jgi:hypothetical protein
LPNFDSEFGEVMTDLAKAAGPVFDAIFPHVENPPPTPVANNADAFVEWAAAHLLHAATLFSAYPDVTVKEIKAMATEAGVTGIAKQLPFLVDQIVSCVRRGGVASARQGAPDPERSRHRRHSPLCPICAAGEQPSWFLYRL